DLAAGLAGQPPVLARHLVQNDLYVMRGEPKRRQFRHQRRIKPALGLNAASSKETDLDDYIALTHMRRHDHRVGIDLHQPDASIIFGVENPGDKRPLHGLKDLAALRTEPATSRFYSGRRHRQVPSCTVLK